MKNIMIMVYLLVAMLLSSLSHAQRYLPGMRGMTAGAGIIENNGYYLSAGYQEYTKNKNRWAFDIDFLQKKYTLNNDNTVPLRQFTAGAGYYINVLSDASKSFFLSTGVAAVMGYETINMGKKLLLDGTRILAKDAWLYGGAFIIEAEYYLDDKYVFLLTFKEQVLGGSDVSNFHTQFGLGVKIIID